MNYIASIYSKGKKYDIIISNDFNELSFRIGELKFIGSSFDDFELAVPQKYSGNEASRFCFNEIDVEHHSYYQLCSCELKLRIPVFLINMNNKKLQQETLLMNLFLGNPSKNGGIEKEELSLSLIIGTEKHIGTGDFFEDALNQISKKLVGRYKFRSCFGCQFSDYSVFGQGLFGSMLCFRNQKKEYLAVKSKLEYMKLKKPSEVVQEIYCCDEFEVRTENTGYRG